MSSSSEFPTFDLLVRGRIATFSPAPEDDAPGQDASDDYGLIDDGALALEGDRIVWVGRARDLPEDCLATGSSTLRNADGQERRILDLRGQLVTPGLIDCHTHLVWGGDRTDEFEQRLTGVPYEEISRRGGGINSSVRATRAASEAELYEAARHRLEGLMAEGVTTVEMKSGYGLELETEARTLRVARRLGEELPVEVKTTFLGAHAVPPELSGRSDAYMNRVIDEMLPALCAEGLVDAVDAFCEGIAFQPDQVERLFVAARSLALPVKLHAEQLTLSGGAELAARHGALSADHLEYLDEAGVRAMADAGTVAVLLPGAYYFLRETQAPPVELLRRHGVKLAVATDLNPGSSPVHSLLTAANLACLLFGMTPAETLAGITREAAVALGLGREVGALEIGKRADLALWRATRPVELVANLGADLSLGRVVGGRVFLSNQGAENLGSDGTGGA